MRIHVPDDNDFHYLSVALILIVLPSVLRAQCSVESHVSGVDIGVVPQCWIRRAMSRHEMRRSLLAGISNSGNIVSAIEGYDSRALILLAVRNVATPLLQRSFQRFDPTPAI